MKKLIDILSWDSDFLGVKVAKTNITDGIVENINEIMSFISENEVSLIYHFQDPLNKKDIFSLNDHGFLITDEKVILKKKIEKKHEIRSVNHSITEFSKDTDNINELYEINKLVSEISRYAYDARINPDKTKELYRLWIYNGINNGFCDRTFIYKIKDKIVGFIMMKFKGKDANISLIGVDIQYRRMHIGSDLIDYVVEYLRDYDFENLYVDTQFRNVKGLNLYLSKKFVIDSTILVYHKWM